MFTLFHLVFLTAGLHAGGAVLSAACSWSDALSANGKCFKYVKEAKTFQEAQKYCETIPGGGMLAKIDSNNDLLQLDLSSVGYNAYLWIGANDIENEGKFQWTDGSEATFTGLGQIFPYDPDVDGDCISLTAFRKKLVNMNCIYKMPFLCMEKSCTQVVDLIYVLDSSSSIGQTNFQKQISFAIDLASNLTIGQQDVLVGAVVFSFDPVKYFDFKDHLSFSDISKNLSAITYKGHGTRTNKALDLITNDEMFTPAAGARDDSLKIVIVLTDGKSANQTKTQEAATRLKSQGYTIYAGGIGAAVHSKLLAIASDSSNVFKPDSDDALSQIITSVSQQACSVQGGTGADK